MRKSRTNGRWALIAAIVVAATSVAGCTSQKSQAFCQIAGEECDEEIFGIPVDGVGNSDDSVAVCAKQVDTYLASLRANQEEVCQDLAAAYEEFMDCAIEEGNCDAWTDNDCDNERDDVNDLLQDADNKCNE